MDKEQIQLNYFSGRCGNCRKIHLDPDERWSYQNAQDEDTPEDRISFLMLSTQEIGYALGLGHSDVSNMFTFYQSKVTPYRLMIK